MYLRSPMAFHGFIYLPKAFQYEDNHLSTATYNKKDGKDKTLVSTIYTFDEHNMITARNTIDYTPDRKSSSSSIWSSWDGNKVVENNCSTGGSLVFTSFKNYDWTEMFIYQHGKNQKEGEKERWVRTIRYKALGED